MNETFHIVTLGCKVNQYESQALREAWLKLGFAESLLAEGASFIVVNSCAITAKAVADVRAAVRRLHKAAPYAKIIVTGCAAQVAGEELADLPGVLRVIPQSDKKSLLAGPEPAPDGSPRAFFISDYERSRAVLNVQDGCSHGCAYCIVPAARGASRSRPVEDCLAEGQRLLDAGFREIVLSGVNLRQYAHDGQDFWDLAQTLEKAFAPEWAGRMRFRISSLEPGQLHGRALETLGQSRLIAPHLHISMQSGSRDVLRRMNRGHYRPEQLAEFLHGLSGVWPLFGLGADFIAGFPGETRGEHQETLALVSELPFTYAHVFPFSSRPGTRAEAMPGQVPHAEKKERAAELRDLAEKKKKAFIRAMLDVPCHQVVFEGSGNESDLGVNEYYVECQVPSAQGFTPRELSSVRPKGISQNKLLVEKI